MRLWQGADTRSGLGLLPAVQPVHSACQAWVSHGASFLASGHTRPTDTYTAGN